MNTGSRPTTGELSLRASSIASGRRPFEDFYRAELPRLVALARGLCPPALAEDIAQEAMLVAYRRWREVGELDNPEAWVRRTTANMAVSQFRRRMAEVRALRRHRDGQVDQLSEDHEEFWAMVRTLPRRQAQVVALHYLYDLPVADVAATLEVSEGSVKVHLSRAREAIGRRLGSDPEELP